ncbi:MAG: glycosyltransferase family 2 protein [Proteobacteria bacterium]|nr:glycosyltransferase family 2 protein [Pseudomonadota bacterium]
MKKISATIIVLNEEANIGDCLESLDFVDEIIVLDSGSADRTVEICKSYGATVYTDEWLGFGRQKNLAATRTANDWVFNIDADERVTPGLRAEILDAVERDEKNGYCVPRKNHFGGRWVRRCGWYPDYNLRLYKKSTGSFNERRVHEAVQIEGGSKAAGYLKNPLIHLTYASVEEYLARAERYSTLGAEELYESGRRTRATDTTLRPLFTFFKMYILKLGFLDGALGFKLSTLYAGYTRAKYIKLKALSEGG